MTGSTEATSRALVLATRRYNPLTPLLGLPLVARTLFTLERAGIEDAHIVVDDEADEVRRAVGRYDRLRIRLHWLASDRVDEFASEAASHGPLVLTTTDRVFDAGIVTRLLEDGDALEGVAVAVDSAPKGDREAERVCVSGTRIERIGELPGMSGGLATGVFLVAPTEFALGNGAEVSAAVADLVRLSVEKGVARAVDVTGFHWRPVRDDRDAARAERELLQSARKHSDGPFSKYLNRPISLAISRRLVRTRATPNQITTANLLLGLMCGFFAAIGGYVPFLASGILFHLTSVFDGIDGEMAKLTFRESRSGQWFDTISDNVTFLVFFIGLTIGVRRSGLPDFYFISGLVGFGVAFISLANLYMYLIRYKKSGSLLAVKYGFETGTSWFSSMLRFLAYLTKRDFMGFGVLVLAAVGQMRLVLPIFAWGAAAFLLPVTVWVNVGHYLQLKRARKPGMGRWRTGKRFGLAEEER